MTSINEIPKTPTQMAGAQRDGIDALDLEQKVTFQAYSRAVLPLDGYVFWQPTVQLTVKGSLHYMQEINQSEDETVGDAGVTFSSFGRVQDFDDAPINTIYVGVIGNFRYAFSQQQGFYTQAGIWHYFGKRIAPAMMAQLLDNPGSIDASQAVTSNSLALWLAFNAYKSPIPNGYVNNVTLYPAFLVSPNLVPPYGVIDVQDTDGLQSAPYIDPNTSSHYQLLSDKVRITLYGLQHNAGIDYLDAILQYSLNTGNFGIMNVPFVKDGKRFQSELQAVAMQKFIDLEISYYQTRVATVAEELIESVGITFITE